MRPSKQKMAGRLDDLEQAGSADSWEFRDERTGRRFRAPFGVVLDLIAPGIYEVDNRAGWVQRIAHAHNDVPSGTLGSDAIAAARDELGLPTDGYPRSIMPLDGKALVSAAMASPSPRHNTA